MKFIIEDFLYFIVDANDESHIRHIFQAQLLSITGYDDLLDHIICMALEELDLTLKLAGDIATPLIDEFIKFVTAGSVQLKRLEMVSFNSKSVNEFTSPHRMKLLELHSGDVRLDWNRNSITNYIPLNFVTCLSCGIADLSELLTSDMFNNFTSLTKFSICPFSMSELSRLEGMMERLQLAVPSMKQLYLVWLDYEVAGQSVVDSLVEANTFIRKHKNLNIQFHIRFAGHGDIRTYWRFDSKTQISLPLHTECPIDIKSEVDKLEQWCSISGIVGLSLSLYILGAIPFVTNTEMIPFIPAISSTVEVVYLICLNH
ncbi:unnamed protein product [Ambrosiozyma monospora]|uniref:Unnamed protein product n=1 Tax=Ambrosiozyma monospora TaxID=43982 RepID=A0A9W6W722_AMBMO|nr:unnamed protein product [Ambrosiozyma monospora]